MTDNLERDAEEPTCEETLSATRLKKLRRYENIKIRKKEKRKETKKRQQLQRKEEKSEDNEESEHVSKKIYKELTRQKAKEALQSGIKVVINCSYEKSMNEKECCKLAGQIRRLYGANLKASTPFHIYLANMNEDGNLYKECCRQNDGFKNYMVDRTHLSVLDLFPKDDVTWLTPDSETALESIDPERVYVIGGLVDHQILKDKSHRLADELLLNTARLPIPEYMERADNVDGAFNSVLTVNQVFEILLHYNESGDWNQALVNNVPKRKGWVLKTK